MSTVRRGLFFAVEGGDKSGKTSNIARIVMELNLESIPTIAVKFPARETDIGKIIDQYLTKKIMMDERAIHLLFAANRWERNEKIRGHLLAGRNVFTDRYAFSGAAYSAARNNLGLEWCKGADRGLLAPDKIIYLNAHPEVAAKRQGYGSERYEFTEFQARVRSNFEFLRGDDWVEIDADNEDREAVYEQIMCAVLETIDGDRGRRDISTLWEEEKEPALDRSISCSEKVLFSAEKLSNQTGSALQEIEERQEFPKTRDKQCQ